MRQASVPRTLSARRPGPARSGSSNPLPFVKLGARPNVVPLSRERRISNSVRTELNVGTTSVPFVGCRGC
jgi:hypothetical protein